MTQPCPICRKPAIATYRPFCSLRCSEIDLGRWFGETYRVPADHATEDEAASEETAG